MIKLAFAALIILTFLFQVQSTQPTVAQQDSGFPQVDLGPGFQTNQIDYAYKFYNSTLQTNYTYLVNSNWGPTFGNGSLISAGITPDIFSTSQVLTIFGSSSTSTTPEIDAVRSGLNQGKGLLYLVDNSSSAAQNFFDTLFGVQLVNFTSKEIPGSTFSGALPYIIATEFGSPTTPLTQNVTKLVLPHTVGMSINTTAVSQSNLTIKDIYPVVYDSSQNQLTDLGVAIETGYYGRILIMGSSQMFSNDMFETNGTYAGIQGVDNGQFATNAINWLGRGTGYFKMYGYTLTVTPLEVVNRGIIINGTANIVNDRNKTLSDVEVRYEIELTNQILDYNYMSYIGNNTYYGSIETRKVMPGL